MHKFEERIEKTHTVIVCVCGSENSIWKKLASMFMANRRIKIDGSANEWVTNKYTRIVIIAHIIAMSAFKAAMETFF